MSLMPKLQYHFSRLVQFAAFPDLVLVCLSGDLRNEQIFNIIMIGSSVSTVMCTLAPMWYVCWVSGFSSIVERDIMRGLNVATMSGSATFLLQLLD